MTNWQSAFNECYKEIEKRYGNAYSIKLEINFVPHSNKKHIRRCSLSYIEDFAIED